MIGKAMRALLCAVVGYAAMAAAPVHADDPVQIDCTLLSLGGGGNGGTTFHHVVGTAVWEWQSSGIASCGSGGQSQYEATFTAAGKSTGLGLCSPEGTVTNLALQVDMTFFKIDTGTPISIHEVWGADTTTFPETTPFLITRSGSQIGQGTLFTHIFDRCPPDGTPSTVFEWTQSL